MTDTVYKVTVDAAAANAELDRLHKSATSAAGAEDKLRTSTAALSREFAAYVPAAKAASKAADEVALSWRRAGAQNRELGSYTRGTSQSLDMLAGGLQKTAARLPDILGKQSAAIILAGQALGTHNDQIGKAVQGLGVLSAAYGAGGPWAVAILGAITLYGEVSQTLKEAAEAEGVWVDSLKSAGRAADELRKNSIDTLKDSVKGLQQQVVDFGVTSEQILVISAGNAAIAADAQVTRLGEEIESREKALSGRADRVRRARITGQREIFEAYDLEVALVERLKERRDAATRDAATAKTAFEGANAALAALEELQKKAAAKAKAVEKYNAQTAELLGEIKDAGADFDSFGSSLNETTTTSGAFDARQRLADEAFRQREANYKTIEAADTEHRRRIAANEEMFAQMSYAQAKEAAQARLAIMQDVAGTALSITASASQQLIADLIGQQDKALERFGVAVMGQAGQALIGYGAQAIGRGILEASNPVTAPLAPASFTAGALLVGAGVGLGGAAGGLGTLLGGGAGSSGGAARGAPRGPSGGAPSAGGGGTNITINYSGAAGPSADQGARAVVEAQRRAASRELGRSPDR
jgi:hypothetical protein